MVATDIAARGIDIDQLPHVVNYDLPNVPGDYVHRIGRTGRAGADGEAISLVCVDEHAFLRDIERLIKRQIPSEVVPGFEPDPNAKPQAVFAQRGRGRPGQGQGQGPRQGAGPGRGTERNGRSYGPSHKPAGGKPSGAQRRLRATAATRVTAAARRVRARAPRPRSLTAAIRRRAGSRRPFLFLHRRLFAAQHALRDNATIMNATIVRPAPYRLRHPGSSSSGAMPGRARS